MRRFFPERIEDGIAYFSQQESKHISKVLRMAVGDLIIVPEGRGEWICKLSEVNLESCKAQTMEFRGCDAEPKKKLTLYMAYSKSDKMELVVQKAVELGISSYRPFISSRCVKVPDDKGAAKANERFRRIAFEAVKQCGRAEEIEVNKPISFTDLLQEIKEHDVTLFAYEASEGSLREALSACNDNIAMIIGPEGGFSEKEAEEIISAGGISVSLGTRILRAETAAIALASIVAFEAGC